jgi:hypothetical protein
VRGGAAGRWRRGGGWWRRVGNRVQSASCASRGLPSPSSRSVAVASNRGAGTGCLEVVTVQSGTRWPPCVCWKPKSRGPAPVAGLGAGYGDDGAQIIAKVPRHRHRHVDAAHAVGAAEVVGVVGGRARRQAGEVGDDATNVEHKDGAPAAVGTKAAGERVWNGERNKRHRGVRAAGVAVLPAPQRDAARHEAASCRAAAGWRPCRRSDQMRGQKANTYESLNG